MLRPVVKSVSSRFIAKSARRLASLSSDAEPNVPIQLLLKMRRPPGATGGRTLTAEPVFRYPVVAKLFASQR